MTSRVFRTLSSAFFACVLSLPAFAQTPPAADKVDALAKKYATELDCSAASQDPMRNWCPAAALNKFPFKPVTAPQSFLGLSMGLKDGESVKQKSLSSTQLAILHLTANTARVTDLTPSNESEKQELMKVVFDLAGLLKGTDRSGQMKVSTGLLSFIKSESQKPGYPLAAQKNAMNYAGKLPSGLYYVEDPRTGPAYVVVEAAPDGILINVFSTASLVAQ